MAGSGDSTAGRPAHGQQKANSWIIGRQQLAASPRRPIHHTRKCVWTLDTFWVAAIEEVSLLVFTPEHAAVGDISEAAPMCQNTLRRLQQGRKDHANLLIPASLKRGVPITCHQWSAQLDTERQRLTRQSVRHQLVPAGGSLCLCPPPSNQMEVYRSCAEEQQQRRRRGR